MDADLDAQFEANRPRLQSVAYRMLGSLTEAEDAVQETWIRLSRSDRDSIDNLGGWLTTVLSRVCLGMLRSRRTRPEEPPQPDEPEPELAGPEEEAVLADTMGPALLLVLETLTPSERLAFVLHDLFAVPFENIAPIVGRSPAAARQLASRARRRVQGSDEMQSGDRRRQQEVVEAFLAASRRGEFEALIRMLDPEAVLRADRAAVQAAAANRDQGAPLLEPEVRGARAVAMALSGRATAARLALVDGVPGAVWAPGGRPRAVFAFRLVGSTITEIEIVTDPSVVAALQVQVLA
jgi:RNA polymerase sigma-70 factor (ECF subfamily)